MDRNLDISEIFSNEAHLLATAREQAIRIHGTGDIKAAGNEVETAVRQYFSRSLPSRYYVTHGHLIDAKGITSSQLDIIITDNEALPSLLTTADGTEYVPATSAYAVGEIKSTYYKSKCYVKTFQKTLSVIENDLVRPLVENTMFGGGKDTTYPQHMNFDEDRRYLNNLFTFMICIDGGDFEFEDVAPTFNQCSVQTLPNMISLLGTGVVTYGKLTKQGFGFSKYPREEDDDDYEWFFSPMRMDEESAPAGKHLGTLYIALATHLSQSYLERPPFADLLRAVGGGRRSELLKASDFARD